MKIKHEPLTELEKEQAMRRNELELNIALSFVVFGLPFIVALVAWLVGLVVQKTTKTKAESKEGSGKG